MMDRRPERIEDLYIESLAYGGNGVGHYEGRVVFVPFTAPGDRVACRVTRWKKRYAEARLESLALPSGVRRTPRCPVFEECGGCQWQHMPIDQQSLWKESIFKDFLQRKLGTDPAVVRPIAGAAEEWGYRSRAQFKCLNTPTGFILGFYRRGSHYVVPVENCPILHPSLNRVKNAFQTWLDGSRWAHRVPQIDVAVDDHQRLRAVVHCLSSELDAFAAYLQPLASAEGLALFIQSGRKQNLIHVCGPPELTVEVDTPAISLSYAPGGFAQINLDQNRALVKDVLCLLSGSSLGRVLDLFCGMGNFSLPVARMATEVLGVEAFPQSIQMATLNAARNGIPNARFEARDALGAATDFCQAGPLDMVMLDPPRSGAYDVVRELLVVQPERILYISCDPPTLVRDLEMLVHNGYRLTYSRPFDLFPQTHHIESVTLLEKTSP